VSTVSAFARSGALIAIGVSALWAQAPGGPPPARRAGGGGLLAQAGSSDKQIVDPEAADRGKKTYIAECITCHGASARGGPNGADLVRSLVVLHDRYGSQLGPFLKKGHPTQSMPSASLTKAQVEDLSHFIHQRVDDTLRTSPTFHAQNILTGDPKAGADYFNGAGKCNGCHSPTGDLKGYGAKYDAIDVQQRFLFPRPGVGRGSNIKRVMVTVTPASGTAMTGVLDRIDDFTVSLRTPAGEYHSWSRTPGLKVKIDDPYLAHEQLLDRYTDKNMHDITAYLETLK